MKIVKQLCNLDVKRNVFSSQRTIDEWNSLPAEVVETQSLNAFKQILEKTWARDKYLVPTLLFRCSMCIAASSG